MTRDELLAEIDSLNDSCSVADRLATSLRAVVELCNFLDKKGRCCVPVQEVIQAIERELK